MLKVLLTAIEFADLVDGVKEHYQLQPDGTYKVDLGPDVFTTDKDPAGLISALEKEREENKKVKALADKFEKQIQDAELSKLTDIDEIKENYAKQLEDFKKTQLEEKRKQEAQLKAQQQQIADRTSQQQALKLASDIFGTNAAIMLPHVQNMMKGVVDPTTGEARVELVDSTTGQPLLDQSLENLRQSISTNEIFKPMIVVSHASGGSANGDGNSPGVKLTDDKGNNRKYGDLSTDELVKLKKESPEKFRELYDSRNS